MNFAHKRYSASILGSLLIHGSVLLLLSLQFTGNPGKREGSGEIWVRLQQVEPGSGKSEQTEQMPLFRDKSTYRLERAESRQKQVQDAPEVSGQEQDVSIKSEANVATGEGVPVEAKGTTQGVAIPSAIALPWLMSGVTVVASSEEIPEMANYKAMMAARSRMEAEQDAQLMLREFYRLLNRKLAGSKKEIEGDCTWDMEDATKLSCNSKALSQAVRKDARTLAGLLQALRKKGHVYAGFHVVAHQSQISISLRAEEKKGAE